MAVDKKLVGRRVCLLNLPTSFFDKKRASELRFAEGPGDWLTKHMGIQDGYEATEYESRRAAGVLPLGACYRRIRSWLALRSS